jgi:hypothetical protein
VTGQPKTARIAKNGQRTWPVRSRTIEIGGQCHA